MSVFLAWRSCACIYTIFCRCTRSGSPHNVVHSASITVWMRFPPRYICIQFVLMEVVGPFLLLPGNEASLHSVPLCVARSVIMCHHKTHKCYILWKFICTPNGAYIGVLTCNFLWMVDFGRPRERSGPTLLRLCLLPFPFLYLIHAWFKVTGYRWRI